MNENKSILFVEDEPKIAKIYALKLKLAGLDVHIVNSGVEAMDILRLKKFDAMLLDIVMPEVDGLEVTETVRTFSRIPIIAFTAKSGVSDELIAAGANQVIMKPCAPEYLVNAVKSVISKT